RLALDPPVPGRAARGRGGWPAGQPAPSRRGRDRGAPTDRGHRGRGRGRELIDGPRAMSAEPLVIFTPSGPRGRFEPGTTVLDAARKLGVDIDSVCGGRGICGRCQVEQSVGEFAKHGITSAPDHLTPFGPVEATYRDTKGLAQGRRLGCV